MNRIAYIYVGGRVDKIEVEDVVYVGARLIRIIGKDGFNYDTSENNVLIISERERKNENQT